MLSRHNRGLPNGSWGRKQATVSALLLTFGLLVSGGNAWAQDTKDLGSLTITSAVWVGYGPIYLAKEKGFFEDQGLEVDLVQQNDFKQQFVALAAKKVDGVMNVVDAAVSYYIPGVRYKMVAAFDDSLGGDGIGAKKEIETVQDLKGKNVAFESGATAQFFLNVVLERHGLSQGDITHMEMLGSDAGAALIAGRVDAAVTYEPYLSEMRKNEGTRVLVDTREAPGLITDVILFREDVIEERPEAVQAVVNGYFRALEYLEQNREESIKIMADGVGGFLEDPKEFEATLQFVTFLDRAANSAYFSDASNEGTQIMETLENAIEIWGRIKDLEDLPPPENFIDSQFVQ